MKKLRDTHGYVLTMTGAALIGLTAYFAGEPTWPREHATRVAVAASTAITGAATLLTGWRVLSREPSGARFTGEAKAAEQPFAKLESREQTTVKTT